MKEIEPETFISSTQIAEILGMKHSTLRKYAKIIDEKANGSFFERNHAGDRLFTYDNVEDFKKFMKLKDSKDNTLDSAAIILVGLDTNTDTSDSSLPTVVNKDHELLKELITAQQNMVNDLKETVERKDKQIEQLNLLVEQLINTNNEVVVEVNKNNKQIQELVMANQQKKSGWAFWKK